MVRGLSRAPRECVENAAHLAAYFSDQRYADEVEVMWTDSRKVARRGGRVGQMKATKKLGALWARPALVASVAREAQEEGHCHVTHLWSRQVLQQSVCGKVAVDQALAIARVQFN